MGLYNRFVLPRVINLACGARPVARQRKKIVPAARGRVVEIGVGSGLNLPFYDPDRVTRVWGVDPSPQMNRMAARVAAEVPFEVELLTAPGEDIPLDDDVADTVLTTYTLCTIPDAVAAVREMARVLKPSGRLLFCEHGLAPDVEVRRWQERVDPLWGRISGGCHLSRDIPEILREGGFEVHEMETMYIPGWRPASFNYWGSATRP